MADKKCSDCLVIALLLHCKSFRFFTKYVRKIYNYLDDNTRLHSSLNFLLHSIIVLLHHQVRH